MKADTSFDPFILSGYNIKETQNSYIGLCYVTKRKVFC
ncbi:hypothetical protein CHCC20335_4719 [Bacillus paralicheniformis]|nr:hypothetical protein CHCC20335_4719 [Bacillus paralicheniformis]